MLMATQMRCFVTVFCNPDLTRTFGLNCFTLYKPAKPSLVTWEPDILTSLLYQSPRKQTYLGHSKCSSLLHTTPPTHSKNCCWTTTILTASTPTYIYRFAIPCIIPAYSSVELQVTRIPMINIHKQQSSFGTEQLDMAPTKRRFRKSAFYPLEIPMFQVPCFPLQPQQLLGLLSFQSFNSSSGSLIVQWLFGDFTPKARHFRH